MSCFDNIIIFKTPFYYLFQSRKTFLFVSSVAKTKVIIKEGGKSWDFDRLWSTFSKSQIKII